MSYACLQESTFNLLAVHFKNGIFASGLELFAKSDGHGRTLRPAQLVSLKRDRICNEKVLSFVLLVVETLFEQIRDIDLEWKYDLFKLWRNFWGEFAYLEGLRTYESRIFALGLLTLDGSDNLAPLVVPYADQDTAIQLAPKEGAAFIHSLVFGDLEILRSWQRLGPRRYYAQLELCIEHI